MKKLFTLFVLLCMVCTGAWAQEVIARMADLVAAATHNDAEVSMEWAASKGMVYSFTRSSQDNGTYIGGITNTNVVNAFKGNKVVTVAAWVYGKPNGCIFGMGGQDDGIKFLISNNGANYKTTTKGVADFDEPAVTLNDNQWNLVAFSVYGKTYSSSNAAYRYYYNSNYMERTNKTTSTMADGSTLLAIGSGNQDNAREVFSSLMANLTIIQSDSHLSNQTIEGLVGEAPTNDRVKVLQTIIDGVKPTFGKVGYPKQTPPVTVTEDNYNEALAAFNTYNNSASTDVNLPEEGKAYTIKAKFQNGTYKYVVNGSDNLLKHSDNADTKWVVKKTGTNTFVLADAETGKYFYVESESHKNASMDKTAYNATKGVLTITKHDPTHGQSYSSTTAQDLFGCLTIKGQNSHNTESFPLLAGSDNVFRNGGGDDYYYDYSINSTNYRSCEFLFEEVDNPNTIKLTNPNKSNEIAKQTLLDKRYVGTFSAPYAVELRNGVEAYIASVTDDVVTFAKLENGNIVPKNTGVMLYAPEAEDNITEDAVPATSTVDMTGRSNAFVGSNAGSVVMQSGYYVLGKKEAGVGFYPAVAESTLTRNKAYLDLSQHPQVSAFRFDFEGDGITTDISSVMGLNKQSEGVAFDLAGRRVNANVKGISIVGGKKVIR